MARRFLPQDEWTHPAHRLGLEGERQAAAYLTACGWSIEAHRFRLGRYDLDLVVRRNGVIAFVEVKTRRSQARGSALEAVGVHKRERLGRVARLWCLRYGRSGDSYRFDLVTVRALGRGRYQVEHIPDAWRLGEW